MIKRRHGLPPDLIRGYDSAMLQIDLDEFLDARSSSRATRNGARQPAATRRQHRQNSLKSGRFRVGREPARRRPHATPRRRALLSPAQRSRCSIRFCAPAPMFRAPARAAPSRPLPARCVSVSPCAPPPLAPRWRGCVKTKRRCATPSISPALTPRRRRARRLHRLWRLFATRPARLDAPLMRAAAECLDLPPDIDGSALAALVGEASTVENPLNAAARVSAAAAAHP